MAKARNSDPLSEHCRTSTAARCYLSDPALFNRRCRRGDFCLDAQDKSDRRPPTRHGCPLPAEVVSRGPALMGCVHRPVSLPTSNDVPREGPDAGARHSSGYAAALAFLAAASAASGHHGSGEWDCLTNSWRSSASLPPVGVQTTTTPPVDAVITYGDSLANNVATGLEMVVGGYKVAHWWHDRNDMVPAEREFPRGSARAGGSNALEVAHFCCALCGCAYETAAAPVQKLLEWVHRHRSRRVLLVVRSTLHVTCKGNGGASSRAAVLCRATKQAREFEFLLNATRRFTARWGTVFDYLWVRAHGSGRLKPAEFVARGQGTAAIRALDDETMARVRASLPWLAEDSPSPLLTLDPRPIFQAAECHQRGKGGGAAGSNGGSKSTGGTGGCAASCGGAFESPDGTHFSPSVAANVAQLVLGLLRWLPSRQPAGVLRVQQRQRRGRGVTAAEKARSVI